MAAGVALIEYQIGMGVVYVFALDDMYVGGVSSGTWRIRDRNYESLAGTLPTDSIYIKDYQTALL